MRPTIAAFFVLLFCGSIAIWVYSYHARVAVSSNRVAIDGTEWLNGFWGAGCVRGEFTIFVRTSVAPASEAARLGYTPPPGKRTFHTETSPAAHEDDPVEGFLRMRSFNVRHGFGRFWFLRTTPSPSRMPVAGKPIRYVPATYRATTVLFPCWSVAILTATPLIGIAFARIRARGRRRKGLCPTCAYDLRAGHEKCPECGAPVTPPQPPATPAPEPLYHP
jgi:hypothetical protein